MCGLTGFWDLQGRLKGDHNLSPILQKMADELYTRGPDSAGIWVDDQHHIALGHRRLAIVDLSEAGHQPMFSASQRYAMVYNGEIYNAKELRQELDPQGYAFRGNSDTEVILNACEAWGVLATCKKLVGMYAFALWDRKELQLYLGRDHLGIKPLYWGIKNGTVFFGSQLKSFYPHPCFKPEVDQSILSQYFRFGYVPTPYTILKDMHKLKPGVLLTLNREGQVKEEVYWSLQNTIETSNINSSNRSDQDNIEALDCLLRDSVKRQMVADVPLGAFLSGGIDSSLVVALMQAQSDRPIKTFTIGFHEKDFNEATYAKEVAAHLGTDHHELYVSPHVAQNVIPNLAEWYDEPFADSSQIPTFLVSELAATQVKVALSGDGGDESFAGYNRYLYGDKVWKYIGSFPPALRALAAKLLNSLSPNQWEKLSPNILSSKFPQISYKISKLAKLLNIKSQEELYLTLISYWQDYDLIPQQTDQKSIDILKFSLKNRSFIDWMQALDTTTYLPDDILTKVDRASMAVGLECRVPLLDHRVVEFAWQLPAHLKIQQGSSKWILRQVLKKYVPSGLFERPKMGFGVPIGDWLRGPLRDWAETLLNSKLLEDQGLNADPIRKCWQEHLSEKRNCHPALWSVLMYQAWYQRWIKNS
jgi:asparagine synthase (glutamine-hydrolysing)